MTSINTVTASPQLDSWMVDKLFGAATSDQIAGKSQPATPTLAPASAGAGVSNTTAQAVLQLKPGGSQSDDAAHVMTADQINALVKANNAMSSDQLNAAMYGNGIENFGGQTIPFDKQMDMLRATAASAVELSKDPTLTSSQQQKLLSDAALFVSGANELQKAYDTHEIVFQKATDIQGLDYKGTVVAFGHGVGTVGESYNDDFFNKISDGKKHTMLELGGGVMQFLSW